MHTGEERRVKVWRWEPEDLRLKLGLGKRRREKGAARGCVRKTSVCGRLHVVVRRCSEEGEMKCVYTRRLYVCC